MRNNHTARVASHPSTASKGGEFTNRDLIQKGNIPLNPATVKN
jgi:hypothetical protein